MWRDSRVAPHVVCDALGLRHGGDLEISAPPFKLDAAGIR
jgi:hypothetical protein